MSNRNTDVYDNLIIDSSISNNDLCNNLNLPSDSSGNNNCVKKTKYYVKNSDNITSHSSNIECTNDPTNAERKLVTVKTSFKRPWTRYRPPCFYKNGLLTGNTITNNVKKLNVRRKAEILQYNNGNRLTKAEKYSNFARGINKYNKKQYAYQTMNRVPGNTLTTDPNAYGYNAFGQDGTLDNISDWLSQDTVSTLEGEQENPTGITLLKCPNIQPFKPTPLSSSDVPRVSKNKLDNPETNPFPVLADVNNPDTANNKLDSSNNPINNKLYMNKNDNLVNYTPVKRRYKGGSEKWPQTAWEEGDEGFPNFKSGSQNKYSVYYDNDGNLRYTNTEVNGYYNSNHRWIYFDSENTNPILENSNYVSSNDFMIFKTQVEPLPLIVTQTENDDNITKMVLTTSTVNYYIFNDNFNDFVPSLCNIDKYIKYIIVYPNKIIPINDETKKKISIQIYSPNGVQITNDDDFKGSSCQYDKKKIDNNKPEWPHYIIHQWTNMRLSDNPDDWAKNDSNVNYRPEIGEYKIIYEYNDVDEHAYAIISLVASPYPLKNPIQLNPWDWYSNKSMTVPTPNSRICYGNKINDKQCPCYESLNDYKKGEIDCNDNYCELEQYGNTLNNPLLIPAGLDINGYNQPWFDPWIRIKWSKYSYFYEQEYYIQIRNVTDIVNSCNDINSGIQIWPINNRTNPILFPAPSLPIDSQGNLDTLLDNNKDGYYDFKNPYPTCLPGPYINGNQCDQANRENYSTLWDCILYPNNNSYSPLCEYVNEIKTADTNNVISKLVPENFVDISNLFAKITINEFILLYYYSYTTSIAKELVGINSSSIITNTLKFPNNDNKSKLSFTIQKDPLAYTKLQKLERTDIQVIINQSCNTKYYTNDLGQLIVGTATDAPISDWYVIPDDSFTCSETSDCLKVSFNFYMTEPADGFVYNRTEFTIKDFLQSLNFTFDLKYEEDEIDYNKTYAGLTVRQWTNNYIDGGTLNSDGTITGTSGWSAAKFQQYVEDLLDINVNGVNQKNIINNKHELWLLTQVGINGYAKQYATRWKQNIVGGYDEESVLASWDFQSSSLNASKRKTIISNASEDWNNYTGPLKQYSLEDPEVTQQLVVIPASIMNDSDNNTTTTISSDTDCDDDSNTTTTTETKLITFNSCEEDPNKICSDPESVYTSNRSSFNVYRCESLNTLLQNSNRDLNELYCCSWYNSNNGYNDKYIGNICKPKIEEQKRWFTYFYMDYGDNDVPKYTKIQNDTIAETKREEQVYSSYIDPATFNIDDFGDIDKSYLVYPIYSSTLAKEQGMIYRKYFVTTPTLKSALTSNPTAIVNGSTIKLTYTQPSLLIKNLCYSKIRYLKPVDTTIPKLNAKGDLYGADLSEPCSVVPENENGLIIYKKTCFFTSNIVVIKSSLANKTINEINALGNLEKNKIYTIWEIESDYCQEKNEQKNIYDSCSIDKSDGTGNKYDKEYDHNSSNPPCNYNDFEHAKNWLNTITNFYEWMQSPLTQCDKNGTYDPYNFYFRFFSTNELNNVDNQIVFNVAQSRIIQMNTRTIDSYSSSTDSSSTGKIKDYIEIPNSDLLRLYSPIRNSQGDVKTYLLSDYFEFGTLVYPEELVVLQNSLVNVKCDPRFENDIGQYNCTVTTDKTQNLFEWRILLNIKYEINTESNKLEPVKLPGGYVQIRTWFGNIQDYYGNIFMGQQKIALDSVASQNKRANISLNDKNSVPFNFPNVSFTDWPPFAAKRDSGYNDESDTELKLTIPQIYDLNRNVTGLCGYFPGITRKYMYLYFQTYYSQLFGIRSVMNFKALIEILQSYLNSEGGWLKHDKKLPLIIGGNEQNLETWYAQFTTNYTDLKSVIKKAFGTKIFPNNFPTSDNSKNYNASSTFAEDVEKIISFNNDSSTSSSNSSSTSSSTSNITSTLGDIDWKDLSDVFISFNKGISTIARDEHKRLIYEMYNDINFVTTNSLSQFKYTWPGSGSVEETVEIGNGIYNIDQINLIFQKKMEDNLHYLINDNNNGEKVFYAEIIIEKINNENKILIKTTRVPSELPDGWKKTEANLPEPGTPCFIEINMDSTDNSGCNIACLLGFDNDFKTHSECSDDDEMVKTYSSTNSNGSLLSANKSLIEIKNSLWMLLLLEESLQATDDKIPYFNHQEPLSLLVELDNDVNYDKEAIIIMTLKLLATKLILIHNITEYTFQTFFGQNYAYFENLDGDTNNSCISVPEECNLYPNPDINSNWSTIYTVDIVSDNISISNIVNFSCFYEQLTITDLSISFIPNVNGEKKSENIINNYLLENWDNLDNPNLIITITTNHGLDTEASNVDVKDIQIFAVDSEECEEPEPNTVTSEKDITTAFNLNGPEWSIQNILENKYTITIPFIDDSEEVKKILKGPLGDGLSSLYLNLKLSISDSCCNDSQENSKHTNFLINTHKEIDFSLETITTDINGNGNGNGSINKNEDGIYIVNNTNEYVKFQSTFSTSQKCFFDNLKCEGDCNCNYKIWLQTFDENKGHTIDNYTWNDDDGCVIIIDDTNYSGDIISVDKVNNLLNIIVLSDKIDSAINSLYADVPNSKDGSITYIFKIEIIDKTNNTYTTTCTDGCTLIIDNVPVTISSFVFNAEPHSQGCSKKDPYNIYATKKDVVAVTIQTEGQIQTFFDEKDNNNLKYTNFYYIGSNESKNIIDSDRVKYKEISTDGTEIDISVCEEPFDTSLRTYKIYYTVEDTDANANIKVYIHFIDCHGNSRSLDFNQLQGEFLNNTPKIKPISIDQTEPSLSSTTITTDNCYSKKRLTNNISLTLELITNELIRPGYTDANNNDCLLSVLFYYKKDNDGDEDDFEPLSPSVAPTFPPTTDHTKNTLTTNGTDLLSGKSINNENLYYKVVMSDYAGNQNTTTHIKSDIIIDNISPELSSFSIKNIATFPYTTDSSVNPPVKTYYINNNIEFEGVANENLSLISTYNECYYGAIISGIKISSTNVLILPTMQINNNKKTFNGTFNITSNTHNGDLSEIQLKLTDATGNSNDICIVPYGTSTIDDESSQNLSYKVEIDTELPVLSSSSATTNDESSLYNGTYYAGMNDIITIDLSFDNYVSKPSVKFDNDDAEEFDVTNVDNDNDSKLVTIGNSSGKNYYKKWKATYTISNDKNDGELKVNIDCKDIAQNQFTSTEEFSTVVIDTVDPELTLVQFVGGKTYDNNDNHYYKNGDTISIKFTVSNKQVKGKTPNPTVNIRYNDKTVSATISYIDWSIPNVGTLEEGNTYEATHTIAETDEFEASVSFTISGYEDLAGNSGPTVTTSTPDESTAIVDTLPPTLSSVSIESNNSLTNYATIGNTITLTFTSSEHIQTPTVVFQSGNEDIANIVSYNNTSGNDWKATYTVSQNDTDGDVTFTINCNDLAGNALNPQITATTDPTNSVTIDTTAPTLKAPNSANDGAITSSGNNSTPIWDITSGYINIDDSNNNQIFSFSANDSVGFNDSSIVELYISLINPSGDISGQYPENPGFTTACDDGDSYNSDDATGNTDTTDTTTPFTSASATICILSDDLEKALTSGNKYKLDANVSDAVGNKGYASSDKFIVDYTTPDIDKIETSWDSYGALNADYLDTINGNPDGKDAWIEVTVKFYYVNELNKSKWSDRKITIQIKDEDAPTLGHTWTDVGLNNELPDVATNGIVEGTYKVEFSYNNLIQYLPNLNSVGGEDFHIIAKDLTSPGGNPSNPSQEEEKITANNHHPEMRITTTTTFYKDGQQKDWTKQPADNGIIPFTFRSDEEVPSQDSVDGDIPILKSFTETDITVTINNTDLSNVISNFIRKEDNKEFTANVTLMKTNNDIDKIEVSVAEGKFTDSVGNGNDDDKFTFYYDNKAPVITFSSNTIYVNTTNNTISGTIEDDQSGVNAQDGLTFTVTNPSSNNHTVNTSYEYISPNYTVTLPADTLLDGGYKLTITAQDNVGNSITEEKSFTIDNKPPDITLATDTIYYFNSNTGTNNVPTQIKFTVTDIGSGVNNESITAIVKLPSSGSSSINNNNITKENTDYYFDVTNIFSEVGEYEVSITAKDTIGNTKTETFNFYLDNEKPVLQFVNSNNKFTYSGDWYQTTNLYGNYPILTNNSEQKMLLEFSITDDVMVGEDNGTIIIYYNNQGNIKENWNIISNTNIVSPSFTVQNGSTDENKIIQCDLGVTTTEFANSMNVQISELDTAQNFAAGLFIILVLSGYKDKAGNSNTINEYSDDEVNITLDMDQEAPATEADLENNILVKFYIPPSVGDYNNDESIAVNNADVDNNNSLEYALSAAGINGAVSADPDAAITIE